MGEQEYKIVNLNDGSIIYFYQQSFCSARYYADKYIEKNKGKFAMSLYHKDIHSKYNQGWKLIGEY